ncbi:hypothetical protein Hte_003361 [Hypoxylon texense]
MGHHQKGRTTQHHCAMKFKGNCRHQSQFGLKFCTKHNIMCAVHQEVHLKTEECWKCEHFPQEEGEGNAQEETEKQKSGKKGGRK